MYRTQMLVSQINVTTLFGWGVKHYITLWQIYSGHSTPHFSSICRILLKTWQNILAFFGSQCKFACMVVQLPVYCWRAVFLQIKVEPGMNSLSPGELVSRAKQSRSEKKARKAFAKLGKCHFFETWWVFSWWVLIISQMQQLNSDHDKAYIFFTPFSLLASFVY